MRRKIELKNGAARKEICEALGISTAGLSLALSFDRNYFLLKEKNQKFKAAPASLLSPCIPLESRKLALRAQTAELPVASFRSFALRSPAEANPFSPPFLSLAFGIGFFHSSPQAKAWGNSFQQI